jgi:hypothetical protein
MTRFFVVLGCVLFTASVGAQSTYFTKVPGKVIYKSGSEQPFSGFRCLYSNKLYYSQDIESLKKSNYTSAAAVNLEQITRVDFTDRPNDSVRRGTLIFRDGKKLNGFFYVEECKWAGGDKLEGQMNDASIVALVFTGPPKR